MKQSESISKLATALAAVQGKVTPIGKDAKNPHFKNTYASLDAIMEAVRPLLAANGLAIVQGGGAPVSNVDGTVTGVSVETMLVHISGEYIASAITLPLDKATAQAVGGAVTYGRRYGVSALLALSTEEDDDGHAASAPRPVVAAATQAAPVANGAHAANGDRGSHAKLMPFGKKKGTPLGEIDTKDLASTVDWCSSDADKKEKFKDLIAACNDVLRDRLAQETEEIPF